MLQFWCDIMIDVLKEYVDVELLYMYVDNVVMQFVKVLKQFDVIVMGNMFGDILLDEVLMLMGLIGMLLLVLFDKNNKGLYELLYGLVLDIVGKGIVNLFVMILLVVMLLCYLLNCVEQVDCIECVVKMVFEQGYCMGDIVMLGCKQVGMVVMGDVVVVVL